MQNGVEPFTVTPFLEHREHQFVWQGLHYTVYTVCSHIKSSIKNFSSSWGLDFVRSTGKRETCACDNSNVHLQIKIVKNWYCFLFVAYETTPSRPHLALFTCLFLLMSFLGVAMYCTDRRRPQQVCEELEAALAIYLLHMKQLLWGCWIWLTMQWLRPTRGGDIEPPLIFSDPSFFLSEAEPRPTNTSAFCQGSVNCLWCWTTLAVTKGKMFNPRNM